MKIVSTSITPDLSFRNFRLRRIVKENHGHDINQLAFFFNLNNYEAPVGAQYKKKFNKLGHVERDRRDTSNILSSVGDFQVYGIFTPREFFFSLLTLVTILFE